MSHTDLSERLLVLPDALHRAELDVLSAEEAKRQTDFHLQQIEDELLLSGQVDGKNAELRAAALRQSTGPQRLMVERAVAELARKRATLEHLRAQHSSLRAIARLVGGAL